MGRPIATKGDPSVTKMRERSRLRPTGLIGVLGLVAACAAILMFPGGASASFVSCKGKLTPNKAIAINTGLTYQFTCDLPVRAYSIVSDGKIDYFNPAADGYVGGNQPANDSGESFTCEGPLFS